MIQTLNDINFYDEIPRNPYAAVFFLDDLTNASLLEKYLLERVPPQRFGKLKIFMCYIDLSPTVKKQEDINIIPTVKMYINGTPGDKIERFLSHSQLISFIENVNKQIVKNAG
jgi:thioredoxin-like negative regulator of GroEL